MRREETDRLPRFRLNAASKEREIVVDCRRDDNRREQRLAVFASSTPLTSRSVLVSHRVSRFSTKQSSALSPDEFSPSLIRSDVAAAVILIDSASSSQSEPVSVSSSSVSDASSENISASAADDYAAAMPTARVETKRSTVCADDACAPRLAAFPKAALLLLLLNPLSAMVFSRRFPSRPNASAGVAIAAQRRASRRPAPLPNCTNGGTTWRGDIGAAEVEAEAEAEADAALPFATAAAARSMDCMHAIATW
jgi:hypothetical protein